MKTQPSKQFQVMRELRSRIKDALDEAGVEMPHTQRSLVLQGEATDGAPPKPAPARKRAPRKS